MKQADIARGTYVDPTAGKSTFADYAAAWTPGMGPTWRASTAAGVRNSLEHHVLPVLGRRPVASLRKTDVEALCTSLALAPSTVGIVHQHLGQLPSSAVEDGLLPRSPASRRVAPTEAGAVQGPAGAPDRTPAHLRLRPANS